MKQVPAKAQIRQGLFLILLCVFAPLREKLVLADPSYLDLDTPDFKLKLDKASQTVSALEPKNTPGFDFTPADRLSQRAANRRSILCLLCPNRME